MNPINPAQYDAQLEEKLAALKNLYADFPLPEIDVFSSSPSHYRMRAEFRIWHEGGQVHYAMNPPGEKRPQILASFPVAAVLINQLMELLLPALNQSEILRKRLFAAEFMCTLSGESIITLIYHRPLDDQWREEAEALHRQLGANFIGRSRKQKIIIGADHILERLVVDGTEFQYQQVENSFTQPNAGVNEKMLSWALNCAKTISTEAPGDLLELYCGNGNFTCVLANKFRKVLATEISKTSVKSAVYNFDANGNNNVDVVRMSSEEITQALNKVRPFRRLKDIDIDSYNFTTVFVDPPRAGLDEGTESLCARFDNILYISCNPRTQRQNLEAISRTHNIKRMAVFDQFPYTPHLETGLWLERKDSLRAG